MFEGGIEQLKELAVGHKGYDDFMGIGRGIIIYRCLPRS